MDDVGRRTGRGGLRRHPPPAGAGLAALLSDRAQPQGKTAVILCGRNIDALALADLRPNVALGMAGVELLVEVRDRVHQEHILAALMARGYPAERLD